MKKPILYNIIQRSIVKYSNIEEVMCESINMKKYSNMKIQWEVIIWYTMCEILFYYCEKCVMASNIIILCVTMYYSSESNVILMQCNEEEEMIILLYYYY